MSKDTTKIGLDIGNGFVKLVWDGEPLCYYNTVKEVTNEKLNNMLMYSPYPTFGYEGKKYQIGFPGTQGSGGISTKRYGEPEFKREALFAIAQIVNEPNQQITIITGVPAYHIDSDYIIEELKKNLQGKHEVYVDERRVTFTIESVHVLSQGIAAMITRCFDWDPKRKEVYQLVSDEFLMKQYLIQEHGWGTTEMFVIDLSEGGVLMKDTNPTGMKDVTAITKDLISHKYPQLRIGDVYTSLYKLDADLRTGVLDLGSRKVPVQDIVKQVQMQYANEFKLWARNSRFKLENYYRIILSGGGGSALNAAFTEVYKPSVVECMVDSQLANAKGYKIWGEQNLNA